MTLKCRKKPRHMNHTDVGATPSIQFRDSGQCMYVSFVCRSNWPLKRLVYQKGIKLVEVSSPSEGEGRHRWRFSGPCNKGEQWQRDAVSWVETYLSGHGRQWISEMIYWEKNQQAKLFSTKPYLIDVGEIIKLKAVFNWCRQHYLAQSQVKFM